MKDEIWHQTKNKDRTYLIALGGSGTENILVSELPRTGKAAPYSPVNFMIFILSVHWKNRWGFVAKAMSVLQATLQQLSKQRCTKYFLDCSSLYNGRFKPHAHLKLDKATHILG